MPLTAYCLFVLACFFVCRVSLSQGTCHRDDVECNMQQEKEKAFFNTYSSPEVQANMIFDKARTQAYRAAIQHKLNAKLFKDKIVIDVGCGTGILTLFAASAGAKAVYCVELTPMAKVAEQIMRANGFENVVTVLQQKMEDVVLPVPKVDIIISEWMGYFGLFEGMFRSVIYARDKYLASDGFMFPNQLDLFIAGAGPSFVDPNTKDLKRWDETQFGMNLSPMRRVLTDWKQYELDSLDQQWRSGSYPQIAQMNPRALVTEQGMIASVDMATVRDSDLDTIEKDLVLKLNVTSNSFGASVDRIVGWFDAYFSYGERKVLLSTSPWARETHWHQMVFYLEQPVDLQNTKQLDVRIALGTDGRFHREMNVAIETGTKKKKKQRKVYTVRILPDTTHWTS
eukprot:m.23624 g.23624  ORF g.23624 m.23624 type:complete len:397 (-) comp7524_c0_seq1:55-1245(-)